MKTWILLFSLSVFFSCTRPEDEPAPRDLIVGKKWKLVELIQDGQPQPTIAQDDHIYEFRADGRLYFSQKNPVYLDTLDYVFTGEDQIKIFDAAAPVREGYYQVDLITATHFNFTSTSNVDTRVAVCRLVRW